MASASIRAEGGKYAPPASKRTTYNFNSGWKFIKQDAPGAEKMDFDDSRWTKIGTPHTFNVGKVTQMLAAQKAQLPPLLAVQTASGSAAHLTKYANVTDMRTALKNMPVPLSAAMVDEYMAPILQAAKMGDFSLIKNLT